MYSLSLTEKTQESPKSVELLFKTKSFDLEEDFSETCTLRRTKIWNLELKYPILVDISDIV